MLHRQTPQGPEVLYLSQRVTTIGSEDCDLSIADPSLEAQHAVVEMSSDGNQGHMYFLKDLTDSSGTTINGHTWYSECGPVELKPGDRISFGFGPEFTFYPLPPSQGPRTTGRMAPQNRRIVSAVARPLQGNGLPILRANNRRESPRVRALVQLPPTHVTEAPRSTPAVSAYRQRFYRTSSLERGVNRRRMVLSGQWAGPVTPGNQWDQVTENERNLENRIAELENMLGDQNRNADTSMEEFVPETYGSALLESSHLRRELQTSAQQQAELEVRLAMAEKKLEARDEALTALAKGTSKPYSTLGEETDDFGLSSSFNELDLSGDDSYPTRPSNRFDRLNVQSDFLGAGNTQKESSTTTIEVIHSIRQAVVELICEDSTAIQKLSEDDPDVITLATRVMEYPWKSAEDKIVDYEVKIREKLNKTLSDDVQDILDEQLKICLENELMPLFKAAESLDGKLKAWSDDKFKTVVAAIEGLQDWIGKFKASVEEHGISGELLNHYKENLSSKEGPLKQCGDITAWLVPSIAPLLAIAEEKVRSMENQLKEDATKIEEASTERESNEEKIRSLEASLAEKGEEISSLTEKSEREAESATEKQEELEQEIATLKELKARREDEILAIQLEKSNYIAEAASLKQKLASMDPPSIEDQLQRTENQKYIMEWLVAALAKAENNVDICRQTLETEKNFLNSDEYQSLSEEDQESLELELGPLQDSLFAARQKRDHVQQILESVKANDLDIKIDSGVENLMSGLFDSIEAQAKEIHREQAAKETGHNKLTETEKRVEILREELKKLQTKESESANLSAVAALERANEEMKQELLHAKEELGNLEAELATLSAQQKSGEQKIPAIPQLLENWLSALQDEAGSWNEEAESDTTAANRLTEGKMHAISEVLATLDEEQKGLDSIERYEAWMEKVLKALIDQIGELQSRGPVTKNIKELTEKMEAMKKEMTVMKSERTSEGPSNADNLQREIDNLKAEKLEQEELMDKITDLETTVESQKLELQVLGSSARDHPTDRSAREKSDQEIFDLREKLVEMEKRYNQVQEDVLNLKNLNNDLEAELKEKDVTNKLINARLVETVEKVGELNEKNLEFSTGNLAGKDSIEADEDQTKSFWELSNKLAGLMELDIKRTEGPELSSSLGGFRAVNDRDDGKDRFEAMEELCRGVRDLLDKVKRQNEELATHRSSEESARWTGELIPVTESFQVQQNRPSFGSTLPFSGSAFFDSERGSQTLFSGFAKNTFGSFAGSPQQSQFTLQNGNHGLGFTKPSPGSIGDDRTPLSFGSVSSTPSTLGFGPAALVPNLNPAPISFSALPPFPRSSSTLKPHSTLGTSEVSGSSPFGGSSIPKNDDNSSNGSSTDSGVGSHSSDEKHLPSFNLSAFLPGSATSTPILSGDFFGTNKQLEVEPLVPVEKKSPTKSALRKPKESAVVERRSIPMKMVHFDLPDSTTITEELIEKIRSDDEAMELEAVTAIRKLLSIERNPPIDDFIKAGFVPVLMEYLKKDDKPKMQFEAAWALTNIASGNSAQTQTVTDAGALPLFVRLLESPGFDVREQAVWALGNIAGDSTKLRDKVIEAGAAQKIINILDTTEKESMLKNATWTLSNLCRGKPQPPLETVIVFLPTLAKLIHSKNAEVLTDASWALSYISDGMNNRIQATIDSGLTPRLVELLAHTSPSVLTAALRTVGNLVTGDDTQTQTVLDCGLLSSLVPLFSHQKTGIRKEALWTASNIAAGTEEQIENILTVGIMGKVLDILQNDQMDVKKEAAWVVCNITNGGSGEQINNLVTHRGCIKPMSALLAEVGIGVRDTRIASLILEGYSNILRVGESLGNKHHGGTNPFAILMEETDGVVGTIEKISDSPSLSDNPDLESIVQSLLETYFESETSESDIAKNVPKSSGTLRFRLFPPPKPVGAENIDDPKVREIFSAFSFGRKRIPSWKDLSPGGQRNTPD